MRFGITPEEKTFVERMWTRLGDLGIVLDAQVRSDGHRVTLSSLQYGELWVHYEDATTYRWERHIVTTDTPEHQARVVHGEADRLVRSRRDSSRRWPHRCRREWGALGNTFLLLVQTANC